MGKDILPEYPFERIKDDFLLHASSVCGRCKGAVKQAHEIDPDFVIMGCMIAGEYSISIDL